MYTPVNLSSQEAAERLTKYGTNILEPVNKKLIAKIFAWFVSPISLMLIVAALLSYAAGKLFDFYTILFLLFLNFFITYWQEKKADTALKELRQFLVTKVHVFRDNKWLEIDSKNLVPGDTVRLYLGALVPADIKIAEAHNFNINDSAVTGESLPKESKVGDLVYSGSFVLTGQAYGIVEATGSQTYFGKTLSSVEKIEKKSILEKDILNISKTLAGLSLLGVIIITVVLFFRQQSLLELLTLDLSLLIAGIPISLPTVMALIISLGVFELSKKKVIVRRLSSLEDLANVDVVLSDKTGTLTKNEIAVQSLKSYRGTDAELIFYAYLAASQDNANPISDAIIKYAESFKSEFGPAEIIDFIPADSKNKRSTTVAQINGHELTITLGAVQAIEELIGGINADLKNDVILAASQGQRSLALALKEENKWVLVGSLSLADDLREDTADVLKYLQTQAVTVKMVTGDNAAIAANIGAELGLVAENIYSQVLPDDKYHLLLAEQKNHIVASTGDGINDLPALKAANVGIAVSNAVDALKGSADIVLLSPGLSVIKDAIIEARKIFDRLYGYSIYRMSESFRLIISIVILGIFFGVYPLTPVQLILLALLNDIPIISLAFNRVASTNKPAKIHVKKRLILSGMFGLVGVANSLIFFFIAKSWLHLDWDIITTLFFLKLTVSGHLLIYVAHTKERWYKYLPSRVVILATLGTQLVATIIALEGIFMSRAPWQLIIFVWLWAFFWMQVSDWLKRLKF